MHNVWHEVRAYIWNPLKVVMTVIVIGPLVVLLNLLAVIYFVSPIILAVLMFLLIRSALHNALLGLVAGFILAVISWCVERYIDDKTGFPFTMLNM